MDFDIPKRIGTEMSSDHWNIDVPYAVFNLEFAVSKYDIYNQEKFSDALVAPSDSSQDTSQIKLDGKYIFSINVY